MASFNKVILMGNLTRDPEVRATPSGMQICKFGLAVNRRFNSQNGEAKEEVTFVDIDAFGKQAEIIAKYCQKGRPLLVEGRLRLDNWTDKEGRKQSKLSVVCENFQLLGGREGGPAGDAEGASPRADYERTTPPPRGNAQGTRKDAAAESFGDDDVPF